MLLLVIFGLPSLLGPSSPGDDIDHGIPLLNRGMFATLPLIYGITLGAAEKILDRYLPRKPIFLTTGTLVQLGINSFMVYTVKAFPW